MSSEQCEEQSKKRENRGLRFAEELYAESAVVWPMVQPKFGTTSCYVRETVGLCGLGARPSGLREAEFSTVVVWLLKQPNCNYRPLKEK